MLYYGIPSREEKCENDFFFQDGTRKTKQNFKHLPALQQKKARGICNRQPHPVTEHRGKRETERKRQEGLRSEREIEARKGGPVSLKMQQWVV